MKKTVKILLLFLVFVIMCTSVCLANDITAINEDNSEVVSDITADSQTDGVTITNRDIFRLSEEEIVIDELVNGNAFIIGNNVTITGQIAGDLYVIAQNLTIDSSAIVYNNVFALADQMTVKGNVNDVYSIASAFTLDSTAYIARDLKLLSENVTLNGTIMKHAYISSQSINFAEKDDTYTIGGNLYYTSSNEAVIPENAVMGEVDFSQVEEYVETPQEIISQHIVAFTNVALLALAVIILSIFVTPNFANKATYCMAKRPFSTLGVGILSIVLIPVLSIFFLLSGILTYVGLALITVYVLALCVTISILGISIGNYFASKSKNKTKAKVILLSLLSVACIWLLQLVPYIGGYISAFTVVFGFGIFVFSLFVKMKDKKEEKVAENK